MIDLSLANKNNTGFQIEFAKCFARKPGSINFDELSRSKLLFNIMKHFNNKAIEVWICILIGVITNEICITPTDFYRIKCLQLINQLIKLYNGESEFLIDIGEFFLIHSYFNLDRCCLILNFTNKMFNNKFQYPISDQLRKHLAISFRINLFHLYSLTSDSSDSNSRLKNQIQNYSDIKDTLIGLINLRNINWINSNISFIMLKHQIMNINEQLENLLEDMTDHTLIPVFSLLYLQFLFESLDNLKDIQKILPDFDKCVQKALSNEDPSKTSDEPFWSDVLLELFISLITKSKSMFNIIIASFKHIIPFISEIGIKGLIEAFMNNEAVQFSDSDEDEDEDEADNDDEQKNGEENDDNDLSDESDEPIEIDDDENVDENFKNNVLQALGHAADNETQNDNDSDCLSDSEMFKLDESLAEVFRQKFGAKTQATERLNLLASFKVRILEMISLLLQNSSIDNKFFILTNVINFLRSNYNVKSMSPVTSRCIKLLTQFTKNPYKNEASISKDTIEQLLSITLEFQYKCHNSQLQKGLIIFTGWITSLAMQQLSESEFKSINEKFEQTFKDFLERSNIQLKADLFKIIIPKYIEKDFQAEFFFVSLYQYSIKDNIRIFNRCQVLDILSTSLNSLKNNTNSTKKYESTMVKMVEEISKKILEIFSDSAATKLTKEINYINKLINVLDTIEKFNFNTKDSMEQLKTELLDKFQNLPKKHRNKINKNFFTKIKN